MPKRKQALEDAYYSQWGGWEMKPLCRARKAGQLVFKSDFSPSGLARDWIADGVKADSHRNCALVSLAPELKAAGAEWGLLWSKTKIAQPFMVEVEFSLLAACPHDANLFWGQEKPSRAHLGKKQECYMACYFGWGGNSSGFERASDWSNAGITGLLRPKPDIKRSGAWIVHNRRQWMYLDEKMLMSADMSERPPATGYFALGVYLSTVRYHSVRVFRFPQSSL